MAMAMESLVKDDQYMKGVRHLCEKGVTALPTKYIFPIPDRPATRGCAQNSSSGSSSSNINLPIIDLTHLQSPKHKPQLLLSLANSCQEYGFFQVINHGIPDSVTQGVIDVGRRFFEQPFEERVRYMSADIHSPVRYGTSFNQMSDRVFCWRDFLKLNCHPLPSVLPYWPSSPMDLREGAISYARECRKLFQVLAGAILETLEIKQGRGSILEEFEDGSQMMVVNCFPACPEPDLTLGMPPHSDYGFLTLVLQDDVKGLQIQCKGEWVTIEPVSNSIVVNVGDHLEIFSNGKYKSALHRVIVNSSKRRISVASLHSLPFNNTVRPSPELVDEDNPRRYMDTDFSTFLDYISSGESGHKSFLESRKLKIDSEVKH